MVTDQRETGAPAGHGLTGVADAGAFLSRLTRLDRTALVRLRSGHPADPPGTVRRTALWARLPWAVLVSRTVSGTGPGDATVSASGLLDELARGGAGLPPRRDADWRWPVPMSAGRVMETVSGADLRRIASAAAGTLRTAVVQGVAGRAGGQRAVRRALLHDVALVVRPSAGGRVSALRPMEVSQRLVQAVVRMGFLGPEGAAEGDRVQVRQAGRWIGLSAPYGVAWLQKVSDLAVKVVQVPPNG